MPKAPATSERRAKGNRPRKSQLKSRYTDEILTELMQIRRALGYPTTAPGRPVVKSGEVVKKTFLFHGGTKPAVDGPSHWKFRDLGTFVHIVTKNGKFSHLHRDPCAIPREVLAANEHLLSLIKLRAELTTPSPKQPLVTPPHDDGEVGIESAIQSSSPSQTPSRIRRPISIPLDEEDSDIDISKNCSTDRIQPSDNTYDDDTDLEIIESLAQFSSSTSSSPSSKAEAEGDEETVPSERTDDFEIDELDSDEYRFNSPLRAFGNHAPSKSSGSASVITVMIWSKNNTLAQSIAVELTRHRGPYISLEMISGDLRNLGLTENGPELERFVADKGWRRIGWSTLFPIYETKIVVLKSVEVDDVKNWELQLYHLYK
ncbi:hypothetical protein EV360DRAFT_89004 [Lentinula raphanica]|nr:hypothetical protein EV360DRAFT_89004 [Lentinula raphanica]